MESFPLINDASVLGRGICPWVQNYRGYWKMLLNALVHRAYMGATIQMRVYDDRLSI